MTMTQVDEKVNILLHEKLFPDIHTTGPCFMQTQALGMTKEVHMYAYLLMNTFIYHIFTCLY